jgi:pimeloyl-ACP methyl ester carboxylesterase
MLPPCDQAVVFRPEVLPGLQEEVATFNNAVVRTSVQDMAIGIRDWGFRLQDIVVPVHIWHGTDDRNIPVVHAHRLAQNIPGATLHLCPREGHWLLVDHMSEVFQVVITDHSQPDDH